MGIAALERHAVRRLLAILAFALAMLASAFAATNQTTVVVVVGAEGEPEFGSNFLQQVQLWKQVAERAVAQSIVIGLDKTNALDDRSLLKETLAEQTNSAAPLWLALIGHGTFDGKEARFNLRGPDVSDADLAAWVEPLQRQLVVINCASASAPFLKTLSRTNRVIVTATRSGSELNFARFGEYFAKALPDASSDLDKDGQVSLLEAFLMASRHVAEFYQTEGRLTTEHALIDDNGDGLGTPADWFRGVRAIKKAKDGASLDGTRANQLQLVLSAAEQAISANVRAKRDELELSVAKLRESKSQMSEDDYYRELEKILLELAKLQVPQPSGTNAHLE
jgi:hypothetical protein